MALLRPTPHLFGGSFSWKGGTGVAEASDLGLRPGFELGRVWDDACDEGFTVSSPSGRHVVFARHCEKKDQDGDVVAWIFSGVTPGFTHLRIHVLND